MNFSRQVKSLRQFFQFRPQLSFSHQHQVRARIGRWTLGEGVQKQGVIFLRSESRYAYKQHIAVFKALFRSPVYPRSLRIRIQVRWNAIRNRAAAVNSIETLQASCDFFCNRDRSHTVSERVTLDKASARLDLTIGKVMDRVHHGNAFHQQHRRQRVTKRVQVGMDYVWLVFLHYVVESTVPAVIKSAMLAKIASRYIRFLQHVVQVAPHAPRKRDNQSFIPPAIQSGCKMNGYTFGAAGTQQRNDLHYFYLAHSFS